MASCGGHQTAGSEARIGPRPGRWPGSWSWVLTGRPGAALSTSVVVPFLVARINTAEKHLQELRTEIDRYNGEASARPLWCELPGV
jgi:hypothetical protein